MKEKIALKINGELELFSSVLVIGQWGFCVSLNSQEIQSKDKWVCENVTTQITGQLQLLHCTCGPLVMTSLSYKYHNVSLLLSTIILVKIDELDLGLQYHITAVSTCTTSSTD